MDGLESAHLYTEDFAVALPKDHPLADRSSVKLTELSGDPLLLLEDGHCFRDQALEVCGKAGIEEDQEYRATSLETLRQMVAAGFGITLLPKLATRGPASANQGLVVKALAKPVPHRSIGAVWRRSSTRVAAIEAVCKIIRASLDSTELAA
jgi:LysR family hydrogen peroxide-inducible transcriptional activator